jgi:hypothetical protein
MYAKHLEVRHSKINPRHFPPCLKYITNSGPSPPRSRSHGVACRCPFQDFLYPYRLMWASVLPPAAASITRFGWNFRQLMGPEHRNYTQQCFRKQTKWQRKQVGREALDADEKDKTGSAVIKSQKRFWFPTCVKLGVGSGPASGQHCKYSTRSINEIP